MHSFIKATALSIVCYSVSSSAFVAPSRTIPTIASPVRQGSRPVSLPSESTLSMSTDKDDEEIERLKSMAAQLRAEAAALEAEKAQEMANAAEKAFRKFDTNQDGEISLEELKSGLEKTLKTELSAARVEQLMSEFDATGTGVLKLEEFVTVDKFRNRLEALAREEKRLAQEAALEAKREKEQAALMEAKMSILNDNPPTAAEKVISVLPYLFPLLDGLQFGRFLLAGDDNPVVLAVALLFALYRSVPFSGFIVFFILNFLSGNPSINRLIRFNMQQAVFLDIALFFPGLIAAVYTLILSGLGVAIPPGVQEVGTDAIFVTLLVTLAYTTISSLFGITPDKIPFISDSVSKRMPTIDMFDDKGRFVPRQLREDDEKKDEDKDEKK